ncbi:MAG: hypothetical protein ACOYXT_22435 [Bacteroidota bacterium]
MKTSLLSHLSENKQYKIRRIVDIIQEVVNPEKIYSSFTYDIKV